MAYSYYRKLFEPKYGEPSHDVCMPKPENFDITNPTTSRKKLLYEVLAGLVNEASRTYCYDAIMELDTEDVRVKAEDGYEIPVRIYHPQAEGPRPVLYFIHGGGFISNNLDIYEFVCRYICKYSGAVLFSVDYRLAPEYKCPIGLNDCYTVMEWVEKNAANYGGNGKPMAVCGDSAGGELTAAMALMSRDRKGPAIAKQMMIFPLTTFTLPEATFSEKRYGQGDYFITVDSSKGHLNSIYFTNPEVQAKEPYNSPLLCDDLKNLPKAYFYCSECDPLVDQGLMYAAKLQDFGNEVEFNLYEGMIHGFVSRFYQKSYECLDKICADINA